MVKVVKRKLAIFLRTSSSMLVQTLCPSYIGVVQPYPRVSSGMARMQCESLWLIRIGINFQKCQCLESWTSSTCLSASLHRSLESVGLQSRFSVHLFMSRWCLQYSIQKTGKVTTGARPLSMPFDTFVTSVSKLPLWPTTRLLRLLALMLTVSHAGKLEKYACLKKPTCQNSAAYIMSLTLRRCRMVGNLKLQPNSWLSSEAFLAKTLTYVVRSARACGICDLGIWPMAVSL
mmetsp:Transcript_52446/g.83271  ORF Transcript_52446/g.83271 Transcript_52446/m.83271 type:complete len:232 (+) Transcript_52446:1095-1790(+)